MLEFFQTMEGLAEVVMGEESQVFGEEKILTVLENLRLNQELIMERLDGLMVVVSVVVAATIVDLWSRMKSVYNQLFG